MSAPEGYLKLKAGNPIPGEDFPVFTIKDILTKEAIEELYTHIDKYRSHFTLKPWGCRAWHIAMPDIVISQVSAAVSKHVPGLEFHEAAFAKYSTDYGLKSKLVPHGDYPRKGSPRQKRIADERGVKSHELSYRPQGVVVDIQLKHDVDWPIIVEYEKFQLEDNEGIVMSGSQQIHWRDGYMPKGTHLDMLFCWFIWEDEREQIPGQLAIIEERSDYICQDVGIWNGKELLDSEEVLTEHKKPKF
jgi:hypothetical protein